MFKAELHAHSTHSDGRDSVKELVLRALELGLNALSITDHDTLNGSFEAIEFVKEEHLDIEIIPGVEVSTTDGHLLAYGVRKEIERGMSFVESVKEVKKQEGLVAVPHPFQIDRHGVRKLDLIKYADAVEVFNAKYLTGFCNYLSRKIAERFNKAMIAGSDAHHAETLGYGVTVVFYNDILRGILNHKTKLLCKRYPLRYLMGII